MLDKMQQELEGRPDPTEGLRVEGYRSIFAVVGLWAWCPHCGLKRETSAFVPVKSVPGVTDEQPGWHAIVCVRCHARGLLAAGKSD